LPETFFSGGFFNDGDAGDFPAGLDAAVFPAFVFFAILGRTAFPAAGFFTDFDRTEALADLAAGFFAGFTVPEYVEDWAAALEAAAFFGPARFSIIYSP
jgi:hypothetical protein